MLGIDDILKRVQTFTFYNWNVRYKQLSPYKCAIYGFINSGMNEIQCEICNKKIEIEDPYDGTYDMDKVSELVAYYKNELKTNHEEECFFKNMHKPQKITTEYFYQDWKIHYSNNLYSYGNQDNIELPILNPQIKTYIGEKSLHIINIKRSLIESSIVDVPKILSIFGWRYNKGSKMPQLNKDEPQKPYLKCDFCGRSITISTYNTQNGRMQNLDDVVDVPNKKDAFVPIFDPLQEHKYFCKWGKPHAFDVTKQYGWSVCIEMLRYSALTEGKDAINTNAEPEEGKSKENIEEEKAHASVLAEQTKFRLEIFTRMQELKDLKKKAFQKCEDIIKSSDRLGLKESQKYSEMVEHHRTKLDDLITELNLKVDPIKKVKTGGANE